MVASKALEGKPIGRIRFFGTRPDDPNDIVPHEDRRELRGYGVFAAWLNHVDAKAINSLDTLVDRERPLVRAAPPDRLRVDARQRRRGAGRLLGRHAVSARARFDRPPHGGLRLRTTRRGTRAAFYESPSIGRLPQTSRDFDPAQWKPRVPNRAFLQARADDRFWAARKLVALRTDLLRAAVAAGDFGDPESEAFLVRALAERRDAIARAYLTAVNPIADPVLEHATAR